MDDTHNGPIHGIWGWLVIAVAWLATSAAAVYDLLSLRQGILALIRVTVPNVWAHAFFDKGILLLLALVAMGAIMYTQYYYVRGYQREGTIGAVLRRTARVLLVEVIVLVVALTLAQLWA